MTEWYFWLVTAAHVAKNLTPSDTVTIRGEGDIPVRLRVSDVAVDPDGWVYHETADLAVLQLKVIDVLRRKGFPLADVESGLAAPERAIPLRIMGFPICLGHAEHFSPLSIKVNAASGLLTLPRFDENSIRTSFYLLDRPSVGGYSGAPVFKLPEAYHDGPIMVAPMIGSEANRPKVVGIVHGTVSDKTGGKMGAITPSSVLVPLVRDEEARLCELHHRDCTTPEG